MVKMAHENVKRQDDEKKNLGSLCYTVRIMAKNKFLATIYMKMVKQSDFT
jgi:hypothetical protein